jgi:hypothetical protein
MRNILGKFVKKIKTRVLFSITFLLKNPAFMR